MRASLRRAVPSAAVLALVLAGCVGPEPMERVQTPAHPSDASAAATPPSADLAEFYAQELDWSSCGELDCARLTVPLDYDAPDAESIELAVTRRPSDDGDAIGNLVLNPGGPGTSATRFVGTVGDRWTGELLSAYDVVGLDPRGVGRSAAVECVSDAQLDQVRAADHDMSSQEGVAAFRADARTIAEGCAEGTGELLGHVDTVSAARDMDVLRAVLGEESLDYVGFSYGTELGARYAELFPARVGRFVLDGGLDPTLTDEERTRDQAMAFERALRSYVEDCLAWTECPLTGDPEQALQQIGTVLELASANPLPTDDPDGRELTASLAFSGILMPLYTPRSWPALSGALTQAIHDGDGSGLLALADSMAGRGPDGTYADNSTEANWAVECLEHPADGDLAQWRQEAAQLAEAAPLLGPSFAFGDTLCEPWPVAAEASNAPVRADGAAPIVVVGTTGDPATPYEWSESLAEQLASGVLVTYEGEGHTAYGRSNACVTDALDAYLVDGVVPVDGLTC
ncbi:alpha/beta hydrolase [Georgenia alba]|uniref:Alpha/beta hydrolase n=1 Tax=Georgenia alba TaxID=2233858 RepID=A0ABW2Q4M2_9MICO